MLVATAERPNILFIVSDDQRYDAVGYAGNPVIQTPNLDHLAQKGTLFQNAFVTTSICSSSRACILSGQYVRRHGIDDFFKIFSKEQLSQTYPAILQQHGYYTGFIGKWGIGDRPNATHEGSKIHDYWAGQPHQTSFWHERDCAFVRHDGIHDKTNNLCDCPNEQGKRGPFNREGKASLKDPVHQTTEIIPQKVEEFLQHRDPSKPFCLSLFYKAAHSPWPDCPDHLKHLYNGTPMPIPPTATLADEARRPDLFNDGDLDTDKGAIWVRNREQLEMDMREYYRLVTAMDESIGQVLRLLESQNLLENTVVLFTSDNGHFLGEFGLGGKWLMYDPSIRVPGFIYDPRSVQTDGGRKIDQLILQIDFTATILELAGIPKPQGMQSQSLVPFTRGLQPEWRKDFFYEHPYYHHNNIEATEGVRNHRWKYTRYYRNDPVFEELFDLQNDPFERFNLAQNPQFQAVLEAMRGRWAELKEEVL